MKKRDCSTDYVDTSINKFSTEYLDVAVLTRPCCKKYFLTAHADSGESPYTMFEHLCEFVKQHDAKIILQDVFGGVPSIFGMVPPGQLGYESWI